MNVWISNVTGDALHRKLNSLTVITLFKYRYFSWTADFQNLQNSENFLNYNHKHFKDFFFLNSFQSSISNSYIGIQGSTEIEKKYNNYNNRFIETRVNFYFISTIISVDIMYISKIQRHTKYYCSQLSEISISLV